MENRTETSPAIEELQQQKAKLEQQNAALLLKLKWYEEQLNLVKSKRFGVSSEQTHPDQITMDLLMRSKRKPTRKHQNPRLKRSRTNGRNHDDLAK